MALTNEVDLKKFALIAAAYAVISMTGCGGSGSSASGTGALPATVAAAPVTASPAPHAAPIDVPAPGAITHF